MIENTPSCRVAIVDDHAVFVDAVARSLSEEHGIDVIGTATTTFDGARLVQQFRPDVVLIDHRIGETNGLELVRELHETAPDAKLLMLTASTDEKVAFDAIEAGCIGYIGKNAPLDEVIGAVRAAARGEAVIGTAMLMRMLPRFGSKSPIEESRLTNREIDVLELLAQGRSNLVIAEQLFVSVNTVRNHVQNVLNKLGAHSKLEAVAKATEQGLISPISQKIPR